MPELQMKLDQNGLSVPQREARHVTLARRFSEQVRTGQLQPGDRLPSFNEMRETFGIGRDTLERMHTVLERQGLIVREHRRGVFVADPQKPAPPVTLGRIGFVNCIDLQHHPYYLHLLAGIRQEARRAEVEILLLHPESKIQWEKVDGVIYQSTSGGLLRKPPGMPEVSLVYANDSESVVSDDYQGLWQAIEHLWSLGHRRIAFLSAEQSKSTMSKQRLAAYRDWWLEHKIEPPASWLRGLRDPGLDGKSWEEQGYEDMQRWLREDWDTLNCTAILAHNDETAIGVIQAMEEVGKRVPGDVSVVGFDGTEIAGYHRPRLTTVRVPLREIGAYGFRLLMEQVQRPLYNWEERPPARIVLATQLQVGQSTARHGHEADGIKSQQFNDAAEDAGETESSLTRQAGK